MDLNGNNTHYEYDGSDRLISITDPVGMQTTLLYNDAATAGTCKGRLLQVIDPAGRVTAFEHDNACNLISITDPDEAIRQYHYDDNHLLVAQVSPRGAVTADPDDFKTSYEYDFSGRYLRSVLPDNSERRLT